MASVTISGGEILSLLEEKIQHLLDCEQWLFDLHDHPEKPLHNIKDRDGKPLSGWDKDRVEKAIEFVTKYAASTELTDLKNLRPVEAFLAELPRLREAEEVLKGISYVIRYQLPEPKTTEERVALYKSGKRTLRDRLDSLTKFDDSE